MFDIASSAMVDRPLGNDEHPLLQELRGTRAALTRFQEEAHFGAIKLQRHSLDIARTHERATRLERENELLKGELAILRDSNTTQDATTSQMHVQELTLSLRKLSEKLSLTEESLLEKTTSLVNAETDAIKARSAQDAAYELGARVRGREETAKLREHELQLRISTLEEQLRMSDVVVGEYASLVREMEGRSKKSSSSSTDSAISSVLSQGKLDLQHLVEKFQAQNVEVVQDLERTHSLLDMSNSMLNGHKQGEEALRAEYGRAKAELEKLRIEDGTAAKMVSRYMQFSQSSTNALLTSLESLKSRHNATVSTLTAQTLSLTTQLRSLEAQNEHLRTSLDDLGGEVMKEKYGRRREVGLRLRMGGREERVVEGLRRWLRRGDEALQKLDHGEADSAAYDALLAMSQDARILLASLEDGGADEETALSLSGTKAREMMIHLGIEGLLDELRFETQRRLVVTGLSKNGSLLNRNSNEKSYGIPQRHPHPLRSPERSETHTVASEPWLKGQSSLPRLTHRLSDSSPDTLEPTKVSQDTYNASSSDQHLPYASSEFEPTGVHLNGTAAIPSTTINADADVVNVPLDQDVESQSEQQGKHLDESEQQRPTPSSSASPRGAENRLDEDLIVGGQFSESTASTTLETTTSPPNSTHELETHIVLEGTALGPETQVDSSCDPLPSSALEARQEEISEEYGPVKASADIIRPSSGQSSEGLPETPHTQETPFVSSEPSSQTSGETAQISTLDVNLEQTAVSASRSQIDQAISTNQPLEFLEASHTATSHSIVSEPVVQPITSVSETPNISTLDTTARSSSQEDLPTLFSQRETPLSSPTSSEPPSPSTPSPHPLLSELSKVSNRYDSIQRAFRDCHVALEALKSSITSSPPSSSIMPFEVLCAAINRLDDYTEDARVELEIRVSDEELLAKGYEALLSVPGALAPRRTASEGFNHDSDESPTEEDVENQIASFIDGSDILVRKARDAFIKKLEDLQHDIAALKRALYDPESFSEFEPGPPSASTPSLISPTPDSANGGGWTSWIRGTPSRPTTPTPGLGPSPTFGNIMTAPRLRHSSSFGPVPRPSTSSSSSASRFPTPTTHPAAPPVAERSRRASFFGSLVGLAQGPETAKPKDPLSLLGLRVPMPSFASLSPSTPVSAASVPMSAGLGNSSSLNLVSPTFSSSRSSLGLGQGPMNMASRPRNLSAMYMLGLAGRSGSPGIVNGGAKGGFGTSRSFSAAPTMGSFVGASDNHHSRGPEVVDEDVE